MSKGRGEQIDPYSVIDATASGIVKLRGSRLSVQVHSCTRCWHRVAHYVERL